MDPACLRLAAATAFTSRVEIAFPPAPAGDPALTRAMFIALVLLTAAAALWVLTRRPAGSARSAGSTRRGRGGRLLAFALPLAGWLGLLAALARSGFFLSEHSLPPRVAVAFLPAVLGVPYLAVSRRVQRYAAALPGAGLLGLQVFRVFVELLLVRLHGEGLLPRSMTLHGRNFDILIGLTAPLVALLYARRRTAAVRRLVAAWNVLGLLTVASAAAHGILSAPSPLRLLHEDHANTAILLFPYVWLPGFLVPLALALHVLSLRSRHAGA